jgi:hypothetical protein
MNRHSAYSASQFYAGLRTCGFRKPGAQGVWAAHGDWESFVGAQLSAVHRSLWRPKPRVCVWLAGSLARPFLLEPVSGLVNREERLAVARAKAAEATGLNEPCLVWMESAASAVDSALCVAMEASVAQRLDAIATTCSFRVATLRPWWAQALDDTDRNRTMQDSSESESVAVEDSESLVVLMAHQDRWTCAESYAPAPEPGHEEQLLRRKALLQAPDTVASYRRLRLAIRTVSHGMWPSACDGAADQERLT